MIQSLYILPIQKSRNGAEKLFPSSLPGQRGDWNSYPRIEDGSFEPHKIIKRVFLEEEKWLGKGKTTVVLAPFRPYSEHFKEVIGNITWVACNVSF